MDFHLRASWIHISHFYDFYLDSSEIQIFITILPGFPLEYFQYNHQNPSRTFIRNLPILSLETVQDFLQKPSRILLSEIIRWPHSHSGKCAAVQQDQAEDRELESLEGRGSFQVGHFVDFAVLTKLLAYHFYLWSADHISTHFTSFSYIRSGIWMANALALGIHEIWWFTC